MYIRDIFRFYIILTIFAPISQSLFHIFPVIDLNYIQEICEDNGIEADEKIKEVNLCLQNIPNHLRTTADEEGSTSSTSTGVETEMLANNMVLECKYSTTYLDCYNIASQLLNRCEPGRGDVLQKIHNTLHEQFCLDADYLKEALAESSGVNCIPKFNTTECSSDEAYHNWESKKLCKSFNALLACQESALLSITTSCSELKLTKLIIKKLKVTQVLLGCIDISVFSTKPSHRPSIFPNPYQELETIQPYCESKGIVGFQTAKDEANKCFVQQLNMTSNNDVGKECEIIKQRNTCWKYIEAKIDECFNQRGSNTGKLYREMVQISCASKDKLNMVQGERCALDNSKDSCIKLQNTNEPNFYTNICTVYEARLQCIQDSIHDCSNLDHKKLLTKQLKQLGEMLHCNSLDATTSRTTGSPEVSNNSNSFTNSVSFKLNCIFWLIFIEFYIKNLRF